LTACRPVSFAATGSSAVRGGREFCRWISRPTAYKVRNEVVNTSQITGGVENASLYTYTFLASAEESLITLHSNIDRHVIIRNLLVEHAELFFRYFAYPRYDVSSQKF
jgi:hypothetical protein